MTLRVITIILLYVFTLGCGKKPKDPSGPTPSKWDIILEKRDNYLDWSREARDEYGFVSGCDSLLFTSLSVVGGYEADIEDAAERHSEDALKFYRTPHKDCYRSGRSKSEISRDMYLGVWWASLYQNNLARMKMVFNYGKDNGWIMGEGEASRTYLTPNMRAMLGDVICKLGDCDQTYQFPYIPLWPRLEGFQAHLQVLSILLRAKTGHEVIKSATDRLREYCDRNPRNVLNCFAHHYFEDGNYETVVNGLLEESLFPSDRLPNSNGRCEAYIWQRELGKDWEPCSDHNEVYDGSDYLFVVKLLEEQIGRGEQGLTTPSKWETKKIPVGTSAVEVTFTLADLGTITLQASKDNSGTVYVGSTSGVTAAGPTAGIELQAGTPATIPVDTTTTGSRVWIIATGAAQNVYAAAYTRGIVC